MKPERVKAVPVDVSILREHIRFRNGRVAINRMMKASTSEKMYDWLDPDDKKRGVPNVELLSLFHKWGAGGFGIIFTGNCSIDPSYISEAGQGIISKENDSPNMRKWFARMAKVMKAKRALAIVQILHPGAMTLTSYTDNRGNRHTFRDTVEDPMDFPKDKLRREIIDRVVYAAKLVSNCGFDGMEISSAYGNLFARFFSANDNKRKDEYGGSLANRSRLHVEIFNAIRNELPAASGFLIGLKLNSGDFQNGGFSNEDVIQFCNTIEKTGYDFVEITGGAMEQVVQEAQQRESTIARQNYFLDFLKIAVKSFRKAVVYTTGGWQTSKGMVEAVKLGVTQGIGLARASCGEPDFAKKILSGSIHSMLDNKFPPNNFTILKHAAHWQMKTFASCSTKNTTRLPDFTKKEEADNFIKTAESYAKFVGAEGKPDSFAEVIKYKPLYKLI